MGKILAVVRRDSHHQLYVQRTYSIARPLGCPFLLGGISITTEPVPSRFALSRSPSGKKTTLAFSGTSISPIVRKASRANSSDSRHFSANLLSTMIFFNTARYAAFLSSGLFHFLIGVNFLSLFWG